MPEVSAFIWYRAEAALQPELRGWLRLVEQRLGVRGRLFVRHEPDRTTFMETYDSVESAVLVQIEALARRQPWIDRLQSPRRAECFNKVEMDD